MKKGWSIFVVITFCIYVGVICLFPRLITKSVAVEFYSEDWVDDTSKVHLFWDNGAGITSDNKIEADICEGHAVFNLPLEVVDCAIQYRFDPISEEKNMVIQSLKVNGKKVGLKDFNSWIVIQNQCRFELENTQDSSSIKVYVEGNDSFVYLDDNFISCLQSSIGAMTADRWKMIGYGAIVALLLIYVKWIWEIFLKVCSVFNIVLDRIFERIRKVYHCKPKWFDCLVKIVLSLSVVIVTLPFLTICRYIVIWEDDYANSLTLFRVMEQGGNLISCAFPQTIWMYKYMQGTYSGMFFTYFFLGLTKMNQTHFRVIVLMCTILFFAALYALVSLFCNYVLNSKSKWVNIFIYSLLVATGMNIASPSEDLYWITGLTMYTFAMSFGIAGMWCYVLYGTNVQKGKSWKNRVIYFLLAIILGFVAAGGSLQITAFVCFAYLTIGICFFLRERKIKLIIPFVANLCFALLNTVAPGNFVRYDDMTDLSLSDNLLGAIINTNLSILTRIRVVFEQNYSVLILLVILLFFCFRKTKSTMKMISPIVIFLWGGLGVWLSVFPVVLGYNKELEFARNVWMADVIIAIWLVFSTCYLGVWLNNTHQKQELSDYVGKVVFLVGIIVAVFSGIRIEGSELAIPTLVEEQLSGKMDAFVEQQAEFIDIISNSSEDNVIINVELIQSDLVGGVGVRSYNHAVASFYNKNLVQINDISCEE